MKFKICLIIFIILWYYVYYMYLVFKFSDINIMIKKYVLKLGMLILFVWFSWLIGVCRWMIVKYLLIYLKLDFFKIR